MSTDTQGFSTVDIGSNRSFGMVFCAVFAAIGAYPLIHAQPLRLWAILTAAAFLTIAIVYPRVLAPLNRLWFKFGMLLGRIVNPVVMSIIYIVTMIPAGIILRLLNKDLLRLKFDAAARSYWVERSPPGPPPDSLKDQF